MNVTVIRIKVQQKATPSSWAPKSSQDCNILVGKKESSVVLKSKWDEWVYLHVLTKVSIPPGPEVIQSQRNI